MASMNVFKTPSKAILYACGFDETILVLVDQADYISLQSVGKKLGDKLWADIH